MKILIFICIVFFNCQLTTAPNPLKGLDALSVVKKGAKTMGQSMMSSGSTAKKVIGTWDIAGKAFAKRFSVLRTSAGLALNAQTKSLAHQRCEKREDIGEHVSVVVQSIGGGNACLNRQFDDVTSNTEIGDPRERPQLPKLPIDVKVIGQHALANVADIATGLAGVRLPYPRDEIIGFKGEDTLKYSISMPVPGEMLVPPECRTFRNISMGESQVC